jgi:1,4-dihydroxy-2-naphthoate octaprenyltransferase
MTESEPVPGGATRSTHADSREPKSFLLLAELLVTLLVAIFGALSWTLLLLLPTLIPAAFLGLKALSQPVAVENTPWMRRTLHATSLLNALILLGFLSSVLLASFRP